MAMRSWLFVPADSPSKLAKIAGCGADVAIIDLEDSVGQDAKPAARANVSAFLSGWKAGTSAPKLYIRVNGLNTGMTREDLVAAASPHTTGIMLPKAEAGSDIGQLAAMIRVTEVQAGLPDGSTNIIAIATETARGVFNAGTFAGCSNRLSALAWGAEDLSADIGARSARDSNGRFTAVFAYARTLVLLSAADAGVAAIDGIYTDFRDDAGLRTECLEAFRDGFSGKMAIHPAQIPIINEAFTPSEAELARARAIVDKFAASGNAGVINLDGRMLDRPHLKLALRILAQAGVSKQLQF